MVDITAFLPAKLIRYIIMLLGYFTIPTSTYCQVPFNSILQDSSDYGGAIDLIVENDKIVLNSFFRTEPGNFSQRLTKLSGNGNVIWNTSFVDSSLRSISGISNNNIIKTQNGYLLAANVQDTSYNRLPYLFFLDTAGAILNRFELNIPNPEQTQLRSMAWKNDSIIIIGAVHSIGVQTSVRPQFIEITQSGNVLSSRTLNAPTWLELFTINTHNKRIFITGRSGETSSNHTDAFFMILDSTYSVVYQKILGTNSVSNYDGHITATSDGGFIGCYTTDSIWFANGTWKAHIMKFDSAFSPQWHRTFKGANYIFLHDLLETRSGSFIFCGSYSSDRTWKNSGLYGKISPNGSLIWARQLKYDTTSLLHRIYVCKELSDNNLVFAGRVTIDTLGDKTWVFLADSNGCINSSSCDSIPLAVSTADLTLSATTQIHPNPTNNVLTVSLEQALPLDYLIYDLSGKLSGTGAITSTAQAISVQNLNPGLYILIILRDGVLIDSRKFVKH